MPERQVNSMTVKAFHPLAEMLPLVQGAEFDRLVADIAEHGLLHPLTLYQGKVLDGRNRERACRAADVEPGYVEFEGKDPAAFVISQNLARRHLGPSERAMVAARMANLKWGQRSDRVEGQICLSKAAQLLGVGERSVKSARVVIDRGIPDLQEAVRHGRLAVYEAEKAARLPENAQKEFLEATGAGKTFSAWQTNYGRKERAADLAATTAAMPVGEKRWPIILADPPWDYEISAPGREHSHPAQHYPVMSLADICGLPVPDLAAESCVLFLWTTSPCLEQAFEVIRAWGFAYKTSLVWDKEVMGMGHWVRGQHEDLLIASKGNPPLPPTESVPASVFRERRREHSRKPETSYRIIETMYPDLPKIELFARQARSGWMAWGNEVETTSLLEDDIPEFLRRTRINAAS
ncbi:MAG TPA: MT-A70 family methyltransferase [Nitrospiraceae bacterium]|nr:MT-A70 family methyltransferase [Nitrospiraceae bacterium]